MVADGAHLAAALRPLLGLAPLLADIPNACDNWVSIGIGPDSAYGHPCAPAAAHFCFVLTTSYSRSLRQGGGAEPQACRPREPRRRRGKLRAMLLVEKEAITQKGYK